MITRSIILLLFFITSNIMAMTKFDETVLIVFKKKVDCYKARQLVSTTSIVIKCEDLSSKNKVLAYKGIYYGPDLARAIKESKKVTDIARIKKIISN